MIVVMILMAAVAIPSEAETHLADSTPLAAEVLSSVVSSYHLPSPSCFTSVFYIHSLLRFSFFLHQFLFLRWRWEFRCSPRFDWMREWPDADRCDLGFTFQWGGQQGGGRHG